MSDVLPIRNLKELKLLGNKVNMLVRNLKEAREEILTLSEENEQLKAIIRDQQSELKSFQKQLKIRKLVSPVSGQSSTQALNKKLDECISQIDHCINYLIQTESNA